MFIRVHVDRHSAPRPIVINTDTVLQVEQLTPLPFEMPHLVDYQSFDHEGYRYLRRGDRLGAFQRMRLDDPTAEAQDVSYDGVVMTWARYITEQEPRLRAEYEDVETLSKVVFTDPQYKPLCILDRFEEIAAKLEAK